MLSKTNDVFFEKNVVMIPKKRFDSYFVVKFLQNFTTFVEILEKC